MKKNFKSILSIALAFLMLIGSVPMVTLAANKDDDIITSGYYKYRMLDDEHIEITEYTSATDKLIYPATLDGYKVLSIVFKFSNYSSAQSRESITVPEGVESVSGQIPEPLYTKDKFSISLPSTLKYIGSKTFYGLNLSNSNFDTLKNIEGIGEFAFARATFKRDTVLEFGDSLKYVTINAFTQSNFRGIKFGKNAQFVNYVKYIPLIGAISTDITDTIDEYFNPFYNNSYLRTIEVSEENPYLKTVDNVLYTKNMEYLLSYHANPQWMDSNENPDFYYSRPISEKYNCIIPNGVKYIVPYAFYCSKVYDVVIPNTVEYIGEYAFTSMWCNNVTIEDNSKLKTIGNYAFYSSDLGGDFVLPKTVEVIHWAAFKGTDITSFSVETPSALKTIHNLAFSECESLKYVFIPNSVSEFINICPDYNRKYNMDIFAGCLALEKIEFEDNSKLTELTDYHFAGLTSLKEIDFGENGSFEYIGASFSNTSLEHLDLSGCVNLRSIQYGIFENCTTIKTIDLSNTKLNEVSYYLFKGCSNLEKVTLSDTITEVKAHAFYNCVKLADINLENVRVIGDDAFYGCNLLDPDYITREEKLTNDGIFYYTIANNEVAITGWNVDDTFTELIFPDYIENLPVTTISKAVTQEKNNTIKSIHLPVNLKEINLQIMASFNNDIIESINIPESLEIIGDQTFYGNESLKEIYLPNIKYIGKEAFYFTKIEKVTLGESLEYIGENAFSFCHQIKSLSFLGGLVNYDTNMFSPDSLEELYFGPQTQTIDFIGKYTTYHDKLKAINVSPDNPYFYSDNGVLYSGDKKTLLYYPPQKTDKSYTLLPETEIIGKCAFNYNQYLTEIIFSENIKEFGNGAFYELNITEVEIPETVTKIGASAFSGCRSLTSVKFADGMYFDKIGHTAFYGCTSLTSVDFGEGTVIKAFDDYAFSLCPIENFEFPLGIEALGTYALSRLNTKNIVLPDTVTSIGGGLLASSTVESVTLNSHINRLENYMFKGCSNLKSINLNHIESIGIEVFQNCTSLTSVDLTNVKFTDKTAFDGCVNLKKFYFTNEDIQSAQITDNQYQGNEVIETVVIGNTVEQVGEYAFADCTSLETAYIAPSVNEIADTAFDNCENISIVCAPDTYAVEYAEKNNIPYSTFVVAPIPDQTYTGFEIRPELSVTVQGEELTLDSDYSAIYSDNINVGVAKVNVLGLGDYSIFASLVNFNIIAVQVEEDEEEKPTTPPADNNDTQDSDKGEAETEDKGEATKPETSTKPNRPVENETKPATKPEIKDDVTSPVTNNDNKNDGSQTEEPSTEESTTESTDEDSTTEEPTTEGDNSSNEPTQEQDLSLWQRIINAIVNFFKKLFGWI